MVLAIFFAKQTNIFGLSIFFMRKNLYFDVVRLLITAWICTSPWFLFSQTYFQQEVNFKMEVTLNDEEHSLKAWQEMEYVNHSADTLHYLIMHLWPNGYKNVHTAMAKQKFMQRDYSLLRMPDASRGYIDSLAFKQEGHSLTFHTVDGYEDIIKLHLHTPLLPGGSTRITTPFYVKLPSGSISRLGHIGQSYQITQWYPKPAVYDLQGWHAMPYLTQGEFFSEFGSFDVKITLPDNYIVGATGDLLTQTEVDRMNELSSLPISNTSSNFPPSSSTMKTLHYHQDNVHDFGWFADKRWIVRKGEVELPYSHRKVTTWALFTPIEAKVWEKAGIQSINDAIYQYSLWVGEYPYNVCTAVDGTISAGGGMEYPTVTVIGSSGSESSLKTVIVHEVGHNWFYGILGSNERDYAWMDEGINSFFETRTLLATTTGANGPRIEVGGFHLDRLNMINKFSYQYLTEELAYLLSARQGKDQPMQAPSADYTNMNYGTVVYKKSALAFNYLMNYLGEELFDRCMKNYFEQWKFKHPSPQDIRLSFENTSGKKLDWFFDELITTTHHVDYRAAGIRKTQQGYRFKVSNVGQVSGPFAVDVYRNGTRQSRQWFDGIAPYTSQKIEIQALKGDVIKVNDVVGIPEYNRKNNQIRTSGIFRKQEPLELKMFTRLDDPEITQVFWIPLVGWNNYNKWMLGVQFHNQSLPLQNFTWSVAPMYSIATNTLNGFARVGYDNGFLAISLSGQSFGYYELNNRFWKYGFIRPQVKVNLLPNRIKKDVKASVTMEMLQATHQYVQDLESIQMFKGFSTSDPSARWMLNFSKRMLRSDFTWQSSVSMLNVTDKNSFFQEHAATYQYIYRGRGRKSIRTRLYYANSSDWVELSVTGQRGKNDYFYDGLFLGRSEKQGLLSQQFMRTQGGMAVPTSGVAFGHLVTLNIEMDLPIAFPLGVYAGTAYSTEYATTSNAGSGSYANSSEFLWNAGVTLPLIRGIFQIYAPLVYAPVIRTDMKNRDISFGESIMFELNLNMMNPFELFKRMDL